MVKYTFTYPDGTKVDTEVAEGWPEVTFTKFLELYNLPKDADITARLSVFAGVPVENIKRIDAGSILLLTEQVAFSYDYTEVLEAATKYPAKWNDWDIGADEWGKLENVCAAFKACDRTVYKRFSIDPNNVDYEKLPKEVIDAINLNRINAGPVALKSYADIDADTTPILDCYGLVNFFLLKLGPFVANIKS
jgi:hypothetical protein